MNANELADWLENEYEEVFPNQQDIVDMLRQQQAELEHMRSFSGCDPAYYGMTKSHPAELTDEEILQVAGGIQELPGDWADHIVFARAILRKAQG